MKKFLLAVACVSALFAQGDEFTASVDPTPSADGKGVYYKWTADGTFHVPAGGKKFDILLVGGGGAGGFCRGGGGGGGGVVYEQSVTLAEGDYTVTVGAGGVPDAWTEKDHPASSGNCYQQVPSTETTCGGNTIIAGAVTYTANGGGGGGNFVVNNVSGSTGLAGGCGGGSAGKSTSQAVGSQGGKGGKALSGNDNPSGGGGGGGGDGLPAIVSNVSGAGGTGFKCGITGQDVSYAGGGGAGVYTGTAGEGGDGGGGHGGAGSGRDPGTNDGMTAGEDGLGGGGGGASGSQNKWANCIGAKGGSGVVIIRESTGATRPKIGDLSVEVSGYDLTVSATLVELGTDEEGTKEATSCKVLFGYSADPEEIDLQEVKSGWTLDDAEWSYEVKDLPHYTKLYWKVHVENNLGFAMDPDVSGFVVVGGEGLPLPGRSMFSDETISYSIKNTKNGCDPFFAIDGYMDTRVDCGGDNTIYPLTYDIGEPKVVGVFRMVFPGSGEGAPGNGHIVDRMNGLEVYGSNDRTNWTKLTSQAEVQNTLENMAGQWLDFLMLNPGKYRYYEIRGIKFTNIAEMEFVAEEMGLKVDPPTVWASTDLGAADDAEGVTITGTLCNSPSEETEIYGYIAKDDYDFNEAAWAANGTKFVVEGDFKTGDAFTTKVPVAGKGRFYVRLFAKAGEEKTSAYRTWSFVAGGKAVTVPAYLSHDYLSKWYDGNIGNYADVNDAASIIFDLSNVPASDYVAAVRVWPRSTGNNFVEWIRHRPMRVWVSYEGEITGSGETKVAGREVFMLGSETGTDWVLAVPNFNDALSQLARLEELLLDLGKKERHPKYIKIDNVVLNNLNELELRTLRESGGMYLIIR